MIQTNPESEWTHKVYCRFIIPSLIKIGQLVRDLLQEARRTDGLRGNTGGLRIAANKMKLLEAITERKTAI